jgi:tripartite-type tricarboxylate transporter receptor subunit TctC
MKRFLKSLIAISALALANGVAAQPYPNRPVKVIIPFPPGGTLDIVGRMLAQKLGESMGQQFVVENRAGGNGSIGAIAVTKSANDGYTLLFNASTFVTGPIVMATPPYNIANDFTAIALVAKAPLSVSVNKNLPVKDLKEMFAYAKANPGKLTFAIGSVSSAGHLATELLKRGGGGDYTIVPYKGSTPAYQDLIGGHVNLYFDVLPTALPASRDGRVRILGIAATRRSPKLPDVPTFIELGLADTVASVWVAMLAPKGTPPAVLARLNDALNRALADPGVRQRLDTIGAEPTPGTPEQLSALMRADFDKWSEVVRRARIKAQ